MKYVKVILLVWLIAFSSIAAFYLLVLRPKAKTYKQYAERLDQAVQRLEFLHNAKEMRLHQMLSDENSQMKKSLSEILFSESDLNMLDFRINEIGQKCNLRNFSSRVLTSTNPRGKKDSRPFENRRLFITFNSSFTDFVVFINSLERHDVAIFVEQFTLNQEPNKASAVCELYLSILYTRGDEGPSDDEQTPQDVEPEVMVVENKPEPAATNLQEGVDESESEEAVNAEPNDVAASESAEAVETAEQSDTEDNKTAEKTEESENTEEATEESEAADVAESDPNDVEESQAETAEDIDSSDPNDVEQESEEVVDSEKEDAEKKSDPNDVTTSEPEAEQQSDSGSVEKSDSSDEEKAASEEESGSESSDDSEAWWKQSSI